MNFIRTMGTCIRYLWVLPISCIGIVLLPFIIFSGGKIAIVSGVIEAEGGILRFLLSKLRYFKIGALTIGHVVLGYDRESLMMSRSHERIHVRQYERWGLFFPLLYLLSSAAALFRGMDPYWDNRFEREAFRASDHRLTAQRSECDQSTNFPL